MTRQYTSAPATATSGRRNMGHRKSTGFHGQIAEVDLRLLRVFRTVAEHGGFAAAEVALGKSKSSISIDISALENRLGLRLCMRGRGGFALTTEGQMVIEATNALFSDIARFQQRINEASGMLSGRFCLYVPDNIQIHGETALVRAIGTFTANHPAVFMDIRSASSREVEFAVLNGQASAGITLSSRHLPGMQTTPLFREELHLFCGMRHPLFNMPEDEITPELLSHQRMIEVAEAATSPMWEGLRPRLSFAAAAENVDSRALLILSGSYIGFLPDPFAHPLLRKGMLRRIELGGLQLMTGFHFLARPSAETGLLVDTFRTILEDAC
ncbi:LysR family transcriptional regulator [Komagataeibacter medellinensis]|uniref:LysR family transcriptional regulator n=1 Tax=Komagataeibacter medellinensis TaxID=1177712 RepID=A0ABQ6VUH1_9PROT|nr:LysR family transcriptional regulator [Komagataeibacter medellinensis]KAB8123854.1 LysR family transcriptional regulator [Komagataeibacter medellinensis]